MRAVILAILVAVAAAVPQYGYPSPPTPAPTPAPTHAPTPGYEYQEPQQTYLAPGTRAEGGEEAPEEPEEAVPILKDERVNNEDGSYTVDVETGNGIVFSEAGTLGTNNTAIKTGQYSYTAPDGSVIEVKFIANENGFQAESDALPVAPAFPHPIPDFVLEQIQFAAEEDARIAAEAEAALKTAEAPSNLYERPQ